MKKLVGMAIVGACLALPAHAQVSRGTPSSAGMTTSSTTNNSGGGGYSGGFSGGSKLTAYPCTRFGVASVSGSLQDFTPSTFLAYDQALAEGRAILANPPKPIGEVAHDQPSAPLQKAKLALIQDANGYPVIVAR